MVISIKKVPADECETMLVDHATAVMDLVLDAYPNAVVRRERAEDRRSSSRSDIGECYKGVYKGRRKRMSSDLLRSYGPRRLGDVPDPVREAE